MPKCTECGAYAGIGLTLCPACEERQEAAAASPELPDVEHVTTSWTTTPWQAPPPLPQPPPVVEPPPLRAAPANPVPPSLPPAARPPGPAAPQLQAVQRPSRAGWVVAALVVLGALAWVGFRQLQTERLDWSQVISAFAANGFSPGPWQQSGRLSAARSRDFPLEVAAFEEVFVLGLCDADCRDLDIVVYGPNGQPVGADEATDDQPTVAVPAGSSGTHTVRVTMRNCSSLSCGFESRVFRRAAQSRPRTEDPPPPPPPLPSCEPWCALQSEGFIAGPWERTGSLVTGQQVDLTLEGTAVTGAATAVVAGRCDADCRDLDLRVTDSFGREVGSDISTNNTPQVSLPIDAVGPFTVRATMVSCSIAPCGYTIKLFLRGVSSGTGTLPPEGTRTGELVVTLLDPGSDPVSGASVTLILEGTGTVWEGVADGSGDVTFRDLPTNGSFTIRTRALGFSAEVRSGVRLNPGESATGLTVVMARTPD